MVLIYFYRSTHWFLHELHSRTLRLRELHLPQHYQHYRSRFTFTFMHLADAFIQSDLQLHSGYTFVLVHVFPGNRANNLSLSWRNVLPLSHTGTQVYTKCNKIWIILGQKNLVAKFQCFPSYFCYWRFNHGSLYGWAWQIPSRFPV